MEKRTKHSPLRWLLDLLLCCVALGAQAQTVIIDGYTSVGTYNGYPLFEINSSPITVSSTSGRFDYICVDDKHAARGNGSYWSSRSLDISSYLVDGYHKLQLKNGSNNYGICYFTKSEQIISIEGICYYINDNFAVAVGSLEDIEEANIMSTITKDGVDYPVTSIAPAAFANRSKLHTVTIPESITSIGESAFVGSFGITTLNFNAINCMSCSSSSFPTSIKIVNFGDKVRTIPDYFLDRGGVMSSITIPNSVTSIGKCVFGSSYIKSMVIPPSVTKIHSDAFANCNNLEKSAYPSNLNNPFKSGIAIPYPKECYFDENGCIFSANKAIFYYAPISLPEGYAIPASVIAIHEDAFYNCRKLESMIIPESVMHIGDSAFRGCTALKSITLPQSTLSIGSAMFHSCKALTSITLPESVTSIGASAFDGCSALSSITLPESVTSIGASAFAGCSALTSITIPESVTSIGDWAFVGCNNLIHLNFNAINCTGGSESLFPVSIRYLTIGNKVTSIPDCFLSSGNKIESLTIPNSVTKIGKSAFFYSNSLKSLTIGAGVRSINSVFLSSVGYNVKEVPKVFWLGSVPPESSYNIKGLVNYVANDQYSMANQVKYPFLSSKFIVDGTVYVPVSLEAGTCDVVDCTYEYRDINITDIVVKNDLKLVVNDIKPYAFYANRYATKAQVSNKGNIEAMAFLSCSNLQTATIANEGSLGEGAFYMCANLKTATILNRGNIGYAAFSSCYNLETIRISNKGYIGESAFADCINLETAIITNEGRVGARAFYNSTKLWQVTLGDNVAEIGNEAFSGCTALSGITIPNYVTTLGAGVFKGCSSLSNVNIGTHVLAVPENAFAECTALEYITIPRNLAYIGDYAFSGCSNLRKVTFEDDDYAVDILSLGSNSGLPLFNDCPLDEVYIGRKLLYYNSPFYCNKSLRSVVITDSETEIYDNEFYGCSNLKSLKIGNGVKRIGNRAFSGCSALDYFSAGCNIETIGNEAFSDCTGLTKFYSYSKLPPVCGEQALDDINKWECTLYVAEQSSDKYRAAPQWKDFFFIEESTDAGVGAVLVGSDSEMEVYDLQGRMVGTSLQGLKAGIYIVKQGGTTSKVAVN